jgi:TRAP-type C4-dicarboxylate transport system permease small subunit
MLRRGLDLTYKAAGVASAGFLVIIFGLMMTMSLGRQVGLNIPAGDEFTAWSMAAMAFLGLAYTFKSGEMIRVGLLTDRLTGSVKRFVEIACLAVGLGFVGYFAWHAVAMTRMSHMLNDMAQGVVPMPLWIPQLGYMSGLVLLAVAFLDEFVRVLLGGKPGYEKDPPKTPEEVIERASSSAV